MHFKIIKRHEILQLLEQAEDKKELKKALCYNLDCKPQELETLICELEGERAGKTKENDELKKLTAKVAKDDALSDASAYAKYLEEENYRLIKEKKSLTIICKNAFELIDALRAHLKER